MPKIFSYSLWYIYFFNKLVVSFPSVCCQTVCFFSGKPAWKKCRSFILAFFLSIHMLTHGFIKIYLNATVLYLTKCLPLSVCIYFTLLKLTVFVWFLISFFLGGISLWCFHCLKEHTYPCVDHAVSQGMKKSPSFHHLFPQLCFPSSLTLSYWQCLERWKFLMTAWINMTIAWPLTCVHSS